MDDRTLISFRGQDSATATHGNFGQVFLVPTYLRDRYGATRVRRTAAVTLPVEMFTMRSMGGHNNCVPTGITRVLEYLLAQSYHAGVPVLRSSLYSHVARQCRGLASLVGRGTNPLRIPLITRQVMRSYGVEVECRTVLTGDFYSVAREEIDAGRPLLMNMWHGSYASHTVTVNGYAEYQCFLPTNDDAVTQRFLAVVDGWVPGQRYIDFDGFAEAPILDRVASLNTFAM